MSWDEEKDTFAARPDVPENQKITSTEWNEHVSDQKEHSNRHESGGIDEITVTGLNGVLADRQDPQTHSNRHENDGEDEINVSGLRGLLSDPQTPIQSDVNDFVDALLVDGNNINLSYDDVAGTLTVDTTALNDQEVSDKVGAVVEGGNQVTSTYDSATQTLTIDIDAPTQAEFDDHSARHGETGSDSLGVFDLVGSLTGQGLERVGDSLQVLSSIWDGENITANVNNQSVHTEKTTIGDRPVRAPLTESSSVTTHRGNLVTVAGDAYSTIFDISSATILYGGHVSTDTAGFRLTIDGTVVVDQTKTQAGYDSGGNLINPLPIPPAVGESSMKLEAHNSSSSESDIGWFAITEGWTP